MSIREVLPHLIATALLACLPFLGISNAALNFLIAVLITALAAQGWNILGGFGGQYSFGHAAFFGTGAYTTAILQVQLGWGAWPGFLLGVLAGTLAGFIVGFLSFRADLRGSYFALVTLAFAEICRIVANAIGITGGAAGLLLGLHPGFAHLQFADRRFFFLLASALVGIALVVSRWIESSRFGAQLITVRENEEAAQAIGVNALHVKLGAITMSAAMTAAAGCLYVQNFLYIDANVAYGTWISIEALLAPIVGGVGTAFGPLAGALCLGGLGELTKLFAGSVPGIDLVLFGIALILIIALAPRGLIGLVHRLWAHRAHRAPCLKGA
jgi:branched-chain amino acid transport system permease protein